MCASTVVEQIDCSSWEDFRARLRYDHAEDSGGTAPLYRGQANASWKLQSPWERQQERIGTDSVARSVADRLLAQVLINFKDMAVGLSGLHSRELATEDDWWVLGRHYGLTTPLLDWSKSPFVAAFFAFTDFLETVSPGVTKAGTLDARRILSSQNLGNVALWSFMVERIQEEPGLPVGLEIVHTRPDVGLRQRAQRGVFTRLRHERYRCLEDFLEPLAPERPPLRKYLIPGWEAAKVITELRMMNITFATLFPDLSGAALQANFEMVAAALSLFARLEQDTWKLLAGLPQRPGGKVRKSQRSSRKKHE
jgi:hypothetical protein